MPLELRYIKPDEKAKELVNKFKDFVNGYVGSSMLTNTEYPEAILKNAKECALILCEENLAHYRQERTGTQGFFKFIPVNYKRNRIEYWGQVKAAIMSIISLEELTSNEQDKRTS